MFCPRSVLPFLALYWLIEEMSAAALMSRNTRELKWLDLEPLQHQAGGLEELSVGDAGEMAMGLEDHPTETPLVPTQHTSTQHQNQFQYIRKNDKRRKVIPLDSIGRFQMSGLRNRMDDPEVYWDVYRP